MFNSTGDKYSVLICCQGCRHHNWMSFASWYTLSQNLPDAKCSVVASRTTQGDYFSWVKRCPVSFAYHKDQPDEEHKLWMAKYAIDSGLVTLPLFVINPDILAIRELTSDILALEGNCQDSDGKVWLLRDCVAKPIKEEKCLCTIPKSDNFCTFVSYDEGWGKFVTSDCINKGVFPFRRAQERFQDSNMSLNEIKILELWKRMDRVFTVLGG